MAETLGSLADKLSIKNLRLWHLDEVRDMEGYEEKRRLLVSQMERLTSEIDEFCRAAIRGEVHLRDEKLKLYNKEEDKGLFQHVTGVGEAVSLLARQNTVLWHLEDDIRVAEIPDSRVATLKREIDKANQKRNDLMDKIDELFAKQIESLRHPD